MTPAQFFEKFDLLSNLPNAVGKMRELILWQAFAGVPNALDEEWPKYPLKQLATKIGSGSTPDGGRDSYFSEGIPLIRSMNVHFGGFRDDGLVYLNDEQAAKLSSVTVQASDVLLNITGASIGRVTIAPQRMSGARVNQHVTIVRCKENLDPVYLSKFLASPIIQNLINEIQVGATRQALTKSMIEQFEIPLPPLAEQKRIVAKVDELMALCDRLEAQQKQREAQQAALVQASLTRFTDAPTPTNLEFLFHKSYAVDPEGLRKTILSLAVHGLLVFQDPKEPPASISLQRIATMRESLIADKKFRRARLEPLQEDDNYEIPVTWEWTTIGHATLNVTDGFHSTPATANSGISYIMAKHVKPEGINFSTCLYISEQDFEEISSKTQIKKGDILVVNIGAGCGWPAIIEVDYQFAFKNVAILNLPADLDSKFVFYYLLFIRDALFQERTKGGAQPFLSLAMIREVPFPLPPLAEQKRIVAKVEELMGVVDRLEAQLAASREVGAKLIEAVVAEIAAAA